MKGLRIIPLLVAVLFLVYLGVAFVEENQEQVILTLWKYQTQPTRLGFVVMTSVLLGIFIGAALASAQVFLLFFQNRSLRKQINRNESTLENQVASSTLEDTTPGHGPFDT